MVPFYKTYISALLHNPNLIRSYNCDITDCENDAIAEKAINLLQWSFHLSKNQRLSSSVWNTSYTIENTLYPPFHNLYAFITGREIDDFDKAEIFMNFRKEIYFLRDIYKNVLPDEKTLKEKPMIVDLFGFVHEEYL